MAPSKKWVGEYGDMLYGYCFSKVNDTIVAEDLVQETFMSALKGYANFKGESSEKSWLFSILKNKIIGHYRSKGRNKTDSYESEEMIDHLFDESGHYITAPCAWKRSPEEALHDSEFRKVLQECLDHLPPTQREVFALRDLEGFSGEEICKVLQLSSSNMWVLTHRARIALKSCLTLNWFGETL